MKYFCTNLRKILIVIIFATLFIGYSVHSADPFSMEIQTKKNVPTNKIWNIKFNLPLRENTINTDNIYVYDNNNNCKKHMELRYNKDKKLLQVIPVGDYQDNNYYNLYIKNGLQSINGTFLKEEKNMKFQTSNNGDKDDLEVIIPVDTEEELQQVLLNTIRNKENNIILDMRSFGKDHIKESFEKVKNKIIKENPELDYFNSIKIFYSYDEFMNVDLSKIHLYIDYFYFIDNNYLDYDVLHNVSCSLDKKVMLSGDIGKIKLQCLKENEYIKKISYSVDTKDLVDIDRDGNIKAIGNGKGIIKVQYEKGSKDTENYDTYESFFYIPIKVIPKDSKIIKNKKDLYDIVNQGFLEGKDEINIYIDNRFIGMDEINNTIDDIFKEDYTGYYSIGNVNYDYTKVKITYPYNISKKEYFNIKKLLQSKAEEIINTVIKDDMSDLEKEYAIHDYIVKNTEYDYDNFIKGTVPNECYYPYGVLIKGKGVCNGYALTMKMLLNQIGIECEKVEGTTDKGEHAWNIVKINNNYFWVDSTWDDTIPNDNGKVSYKYFNTTDKEMGTDHFWNKSIYNLCDKEDFQFLRKYLNSNSEAIRKGEYLYYIDGNDKKLYIIKINGEDRKKINDEVMENSYIIGDWIYYNHPITLKKYKIKYDGSSKEAL
ncbi:Transglutaminase-like superfamily protein [Clostridium liquoris]|uniref:Transglutaminase-like superfamily protein n=1 Tax=Clostridium liquoris TaxID=1289519 RepID=A0A2T0B8F5_9CLOT|nr:transglutaminase domain-containing protein [Clostridium liquoris]PRR80103.1 Transglutaminase-like superfamily protein [Clostridium liquoris]